MNEQNSALVTPATSSIQELLCHQNLKSVVSTIHEQQDDANANTATSTVVVIVNINKA